MQPQRSAPPPSASASLAASTAFVRNQASDATLSNAAAAAALRSHTSSPTPVGETVTKRMVRRGSASSQNSQRPQGLRRHSSSGSMTERSFRNPSPNGAAITEFNRALAADARVEQVLVPLRDGLTLIRRTDGASS